MSITIPRELEKRLQDDASRRGVAPDAYAADLIAIGLAPAHSNHATLDLLAAWDAEESNDDPAQIENRRNEAEEFMRSLAQSRVEMEGPGARKLWP